MRQLITSVLCFLSVFLLRAQEPMSYCPTVPSESQLTWLRNFQANLDQAALELVGDVVNRTADYYVPIKLHIVGNDEGRGYVRHDMVLDAICKLNDDFASTGFHFYLDLPIAYHDQGNWHDQTFSAGSYMISSNNVPGAVNLYYVYRIEEGGIAGYFSPGANGVVMSQSASAPTSNTLPHEIGHYFSLPHTFFRWEYGTPPASLQEYVDGSNCTTAGDGFCDTAPDYAAFRWTCPATGPFVDPDGVSFLVEDSFFMSYAGNSCRDRFSVEQSAAMRAYLTDVHPDIIGSATPVFPLYDPVVQVLPEDGATGVLPVGGLFTWSGVPEAVGYHIAISYTGIFSAIAEERIALDTFFYCTQLAEDRPYFWRVKPIFEGNTCEPYSEIKEFRTGENPPPSTGLDNPDSGEPVSIHPQPLIAGQQATVKLSLLAPEKLEMQWVDMTGKIVATEMAQLPAGNLSLRVSVPFEEAGIYLFRISGRQGVTILKTIISSR